MDHIFYSELQQDTSSRRGSADEITSSIVKAANKAPTGRMGEQMRSQLPWGMSCKQDTSREKGGSR
jgi:hypothetical protein